MKYIKLGTLEVSRIGLVAMGMSAAYTGAGNDWRKTNPRFTGANFERNLQIADEVQSVAAEIGATPAQVALAWLLAQGDDIAPTPGTKRGSRVEENIAADTIQLSPEQIDRLNKLPPAAGDHHNEQQMQMLDRSSAGTARPVSTPTTYLTPLTGRMATAAMMAQIPAAA